MCDNAKPVNLSWDVVDLNHNLSLFKQENDRSGLTFDMAKVLKLLKKR